MPNTLKLELSLEERQEIDKYLDDYARNPSNSNKYRIGLHAHLEELMLTKLEAVMLEVIYIDVGRIAKAKAQLKALMLDIVGTDEDLPTDWHHNSTRYQQPKARNSLRAELRERIESL